MSLSDFQGPGDAAMGGSARARPERPILLASAIVVAALTLLVVLERLGAPAGALGLFAVAVPLVAVCALAFAGRSIDRAPFLTAGGAGGLACGLALGAEWLGTAIPFLLLSPSPAFVSGGAFGLFAFTLALATGPRRMGALTPAEFIGRRLASVSLRLTTAFASLAVLAGLAAFQLVLMRTLLLTLVGDAADTVLVAMAALASLTLVLGGQRSLTLVCAFLGFFLGLAVVLPAAANVAGLSAFTGPLPVDRAFALVLPMGSDAALFLTAALAALGAPVLVTRLAAARRGATFHAGAWALLAAYVIAAAVTLAYGEANANESVVERLPTLGWLGAVWAGYAATLFAFALTVGNDVTLARPQGAARRTDVAMALTRITCVAAAALVWLTVSGGWLGMSVAASGFAWSLTLASGVLAPTLAAGVWWRHASTASLLCAQAAGLAVAVSLMPALPAWAAPLGFLAAVAAAFTLGLLQPRRLRADPALLATVRQPKG